MSYVVSADKAAPMSSPGRQAGALQAMILVFTTQLPIMGLLSLIPIIPLLVQQFSGHPQASVLIPLLITAPSACIALLSPVAGMLADKLGRRRLLVVAVLGYGVCGFAPYLMTDLTAIIVSRFLLGVTEAIIMTVANTLFGDFYPVEPRRKWLAVQSAVGSLSGTILMFVGGMLGSFGWQGPFLLYLLAFPVFVMLLCFTWEPERQADEHQPSGKLGVFPMRSVLLVALVTLFAAVLYYVEVLQISQVLNALGLTSSAHIGIAGAIAGLGVPVGAIVFAKLSRRSIQVHLGVVFALFGVGLVGLGAASDVKWAVAAAFVAQVGCGMLIPALINWCLGGLSFEHRGRGVGIWTSAFFMGQFVSPFTITWLGGSTGSLLASVAWLGIVSFVAMCVVALLPRRVASPISQAH
ncbi:MFS transporter [Pseudomonas sp. BP8]|uniref:MFS transporter n=1 Tax=Pseudomonas sp. BP8 TaxID=2817864 RepID=UPI001AE3566B|nr:MFS transporter [Pseudomonas sp. BP8]MBP2261562.1 MFS family permease [Pseudomonas sp. BP8]HDS1733471.1 MFS transporter [Pseudomonas putida]